MKYDFSIIHPASVKLPTNTTCCVRTKGILMVIIALLVFGIYFHPNTSRETVGSLNI